MIVALSLNVSKHRIRNGISLGDGENKDLRNAIRAHSNLIETTPIFCILMFIYETLNNSTQFLMICASLFLFSRILHSIGILQYNFKLRFRARQIGAVLNLILTIVLAGANLISLF